MATKIQNVIDKEGINVGLETYSDLKKNKASEYDFGENELNRLGYEYLRDKEMEKALFIFKLNTEAYPNSSNVSDSYGEAFKENGDKEKAIANYSKSFELNPANQNAMAMLKELGVDPDDLVEDIKVDEAVLETYVGKYELAPNFIDGFKGWFSIRPSDLIAA